MAARKSRKWYDDDFKRRVADYHVEHKGSLADSAQNFSVTPAMVHKWVKHFSPSGAPAADDAAAGGAEIHELRQEIRAMKAEIAELKKIVSKAFLTRFQEE